MYLNSWWTSYEKMDNYEDGSSVGQCFKLERSLNFGPLNDDDDYSFTKKKAVRPTNQPLVTSGVAGQTRTSSFPEDRESQGSSSPAPV
ncbi:hypothetical protein Pcinc_013890 [Petrolisthes cinctipes]|uniref:Uncharacterized protein n=1 Tax=Petrolisthes cinctipes TaxID=88211 RepID=A0AAE1FWG2_PETCI|nr:hypothetical protein Pcinc_013890 [Petrolisthes cinctipes]